jgi:cytochrome c
MMRAHTGLLAVAVLLVTGGCGGSSTPSSNSNNANPAPSSTPAATTPETTATAAPAMLLAKSLYDDGPRASHGGPIDMAMAAEGEKLFTTKGCTVCHAIGQKKTCPDLAGVVDQRTQAWLEHQILEPDVMTKTDPIAHDLFVTYKLQMTNFHLTEADAKAIIQYLRSKNAK